MKDKLFYEDIAELRGVAIHTVRVDLSKARQARKHAERPAYLVGRHDMPEPDGKDRQSPWWKPETIMPWINSRAMPVRKATD